MAKVNVSLPQGTRDFGPDVVRKRNYWPPKPSEGGLLEPLF